MRTKRVDDTSNAFHFHPLWVVRIASTTTCTLRWWLSIIINALRASLVAYTSNDDSDKTTTLTVIFHKVVSVIDTLMSWNKEHSEDCFIDWSSSTQLLGINDDVSNDDGLLLCILAASLEALFSRCHLFLIALSDRPDVYAFHRAIMLSIGNMKQVCHINNHLIHLILPGSFSINLDHWLPHSA
jgi:hypothetical protein